MGATSLVNVGAFIFPICAKRHAAEQTANSKVRTVRFMTSMPLWLLLPFRSLEPAQRSYQECPTHRLECQETSRDPQPSPCSKLVFQANARRSGGAGAGARHLQSLSDALEKSTAALACCFIVYVRGATGDRKSTRLNS